MSQTMYQYKMISANLQAEETASTLSNLVQLYSKWVFFPPGHDVLHYMPEVRT